MAIAWHGELGYPSAEVRDDTYAALAALIAARPELEPTTIDVLPDLAAGLTSDVQVNDMPGLTFCFRAPQGWDSSDEYLQLTDTAQNSAETGGVGVYPLPD